MLGEGNDQLKKGLYAKVTEFEVAGPWQQTQPQTDNTATHEVSAEIHEALLSNAFPVLPSAAGVARSWLNFP